MTERSESPLSSDASLYRKHNSFVDIRHHERLADVRPRIERLMASVESAGMAPGRAEVVLQACRELLGDGGAVNGFPSFTLHTNVIEEISRLTDEQLPRYMFYRYRYEIYPQRRILDAFPPCLQIEPSAHCNYRCVFCYQTDEAFSGKGSSHMAFMSLDLFKRVVDQAQGQVEAVTLASRGEPFMAPKIKEMLAYLPGKFLALKMNTNASLLDEAKCHAILQGGVNLLVFSADAASEPAYGQLRVRGKLDKVLKNLQMFRDIRAKHYPQSPILTRVSGVKVPGTPGLDQMESFWGDMVDQVAFVNYNPWDSTYARPVNDITEPCSELWLRMFVWADGRVNPCENDYKSTLAVGNALTEDLSSLWLGEKYQDLRAKHLAAARGECEPCRRCPVI
jgi:radical SAM protein with 4Fe4S-binding SPASM domain